MKKILLFIIVVFILNIIFFLAINIMRYSRRNHHMRIRFSVSRKALKNYKKRSRRKYNKTSNDELINLIQIYNQNQEEDIQDD